MNDVIARYEFRVFAPQLDKTGELLRTMASCDSASESREVYLLDCEAMPSSNVKIRNDRLEQKQLIRLYHGLERWKPAGQWEFPVSPETIRQLWSYDVLKEAPIKSAALSREQLLQLVEENVRLYRADVFKRRYRFSLMGCAAELIRMEVDGQAFESCAVESGDPQAVLAVLDALQLEDDLNRSYPRMLCQVVTGNSDDRRDKYVSRN